MNEWDSEDIRRYAREEDLWKAPNGERLGRKAFRRFDKVRGMWVIHLSIDATKYTFVEANEIIQKESWLKWICPCGDDCKCTCVNSSMEWSKDGKKYKVEIW